MGNFLDQYKNQSLLGDDSDSGFGQSRLSAPGKVTMSSRIAPRASRPEDEVEHHPDVPAFLRSVKRIGAGNASPVTGRGLSGRRVMETMMRTYAERFGGADGIPATYTVVYGVGKR